MNPTLRATTAWEDRGKQKLHRARGSAERPDGLEVALPGQRSLTWGS